MIPVAEQVEESSRVLEERVLPSAEYWTNLAAVPTDALVRRSTLTALGLLLPAGCSTNSGHSLQERPQAQESVPADESRLLTGLLRPVPIRLVESLAELRQVEQVLD